MIQLTPKDGGRTVAPSWSITFRIFWKDASTAPIFAPVFLAAYCIYCKNSAEVPSYLALLPRLCRQ